MQRDFVDFEFLSSILDALADPVFVKDTDHTWVALNDAFCRFMGHPREELLGRSDIDYFPHEEARVFWEKDNVVLSTGQENVNVERFTGADGVTRIISTKKLFNQRVGWTAAEDTLPARFLDTPLPDDPRAVISSTDLAAAVRSYYAIRGWDEHGRVPDEHQTELLGSLD